MNTRGQDLSSELNQTHGDERTTFVQADIRDWEQQKAMFDRAMDKFGAIDIVIANAGISRSSGDSLWNLDDPAGEPTKPDLNIVEVNLKGSFYTWKLAVHYWRRQKEEEGRDRCFIMTGSMVAWIDSPVSFLLTKNCHLDFCDWGATDMIVNRAIGNIQRPNTVSAASCALRAARHGNKVFASIMSRRAGSRAPSGRKSTRTGLLSEASSSASKKMSRRV